MRLIIPYYESEDTAEIVLVCRREREKDYVEVKAQFYWYSDKNVGPQILSLR